MDDNILNKVFNSEPIKFTLSEIEMMMDEELDKDPDEMDTDFIDMCMDVLETGYAAEEEKLKKKISRRMKLSKILLTAIIITTAAGISIPVGAKYIESDVSDKIVQFCYDYFNVDLRNGKTHAQNHIYNDGNIVNTLKDEGFDNVILPLEIANSLCNMESIQKDEFMATASMKCEIKERNINCAVTISRYDEEVSFCVGQTKASNGFDSVKQLTLNGMDVIVFSDSETSCILYVDDLTEYDIRLNNCDIETAVEIAQTL